MYSKCNAKNHKTQRIYKANTKNMIHIPREREKKNLFTKEKIRDFQDLATFNAVYVE